MLVQQVLHAVNAEAVTLALGNSICPSPRWGSCNQAFNTATSIWRWAYNVPCALCQLPARARPRRR